MSDFISKEFALNWLLPATSALAIIIFVLSFSKVQQMVSSFSDPPLREVRWGIFGVLSSFTFFVFGIFLTILTIYLSPIPNDRNPVMLGFTIFLFVIALVAFAYVIFLGLHYYNNKKDDLPILTVTKEGGIVADKRYERIENNLRIIKTEEFEIAIKYLKNNPAKKDVKSGKQKHQKQRR